MNTTRTTTRLILFTFALTALYGLQVLPTSIASEKAAKASVGRTQFRRAYVRALRSNIEYCQQWLDEGDYKSLASTAGCVRLIALLAGAHSDDSKWSAACRKIGQQAAAVAKSAPGKQDGELAKKIKDLEALRIKLTKLPKPSENRPKESKPSEATRRELSRVGVPQIMTVLDAAYTDAKAAVRLDEPTEARDFAIVIGDAAALLREKSSKAIWKKDCQGVIAESQRLALSRTREQPALLKEFKRVYNHCASCHDRR